MGVHGSSRGCVIIVTCAGNDLYHLGVEREWGERRTMTERERERLVLPQRKSFILLPRQYNSREAAEQLETKGREAM